MGGVFASAVVAVVTGALVEVKTPLSSAVSLVVRLVVAVAAVPLSIALLVIAVVLCTPENDSADVEEVPPTMVAVVAVSAAG